MQRRPPLTRATARSRSRFWLLGLLVALLSAVPAVGTTPAGAATTTLVDCGADAGALGIALANANAGDTLDIKGTCNGAFVISQNLTLAGSGGATIDGQGAARVMLIPAGVTVAITDLTITGGNGSAGVGIHNLGTLRLSFSTVHGNVASLWGGGIYNRSGATLAINQSTVSSNSAAENGGGIYNDGTLTITGSSVTDNDGGAGGGGIYNSSFGTLTMTGSGLSGNRAGFGGGLLSNGVLSVEDSTIYSNAATSGGGVGIGSGIAVLERTSVEGNSASSDGGGVNYFGGSGSPPVLRNTTIFGNGAGGSGGGLANTGYFGSMTLENTTIAANRAAVSGSGVANTGYSGRVTLKSTIVAAPAEGPNCTGPISDGGYNVDDGTSCGFSALNNSLPSTNPLLDPQGSRHNGGPTPTVALQPGSPAIDTIPSGVNGCGTTLLTDQRGVARPQGLRCDMGAFEAVISDSAPPVIAVPTDITVDATGPGGAVVSYAVSAEDDIDGIVPVTCAPPSGSTFPIGDTTVTCTATDAAGNSASASFTVQVKGAPEQVTDLIVLVDGYNLRLLGAALHDKLVKVQEFLALNKPKRACEKLDSFLAQVKEQRGKRISVEQADRLTMDARRIKAVIGC